MTTPTVWVAINRRSGTVLTARETREAARNYVYHVDDDAEAPEDVEKHTDFVEYVPAELLRQLLASRDADMSWARSAGISLNAVTDILHRYEDANISRGRAVELLRELAVAAVDAARERTAELEAKLTMMVDANRDLTHENNAAEREAKVHRLNEQLLDRVIDLVGKDPVGGIQKLEERIAELESTVAAYRRGQHLIDSLPESERATMWREINDAAGDQQRIADLERERSQLAEELRDSEQAAREEASLVDERTRERDEARSELRARQFVDKWLDRPSRMRSVEVGMLSRKFNAVDDGQLIAAADTYQELGKALGWKDEP